MQKKNMVIVDQDNFTIKKLSDFFKNDMAVEVFNSAEEALPAIERKPPEIVLFEYQLPRMSGIEFFEAIIQNTCREKVLIMMSSLDDGNMVLKFIQKGVRNYVIKDDMILDAIAETIQEELANC
jgi:DNA-binding NarL/FixJ family response regulator